MSLHFPLYYHYFIPADSRGVIYSSSHVWLRIAVRPPDAQVSRASVCNETADWRGVTMTSGRTPYTRTPSPGYQYDRKIMDETKEGGERIKKETKTGVKKTSRNRDTIPQVLRNAIVSDVSLWKMFKINLRGPVTLLGRGLVDVFWKIDSKWKCIIQLNHWLINVLLTQLTLYILTFIFYVEYQI